MLDRAVEMSVGMVVEIELGLVVEVTSVEVFPVVVFWVGVFSVGVFSVEVFTVELVSVVSFPLFSVVTTPEEVFSPEVLVFTFSKVELNPVVVRIGVELISELVVDAALVVNPSVAVSVGIVVSIMCVVVEITTPVLVELNMVEVDVVVGVFMVVVVVVVCCC